MGISSIHVLRAEELLGDGEDLPLDVRGASGERFGMEGILSSLRRAFDFASSELASSWSEGWHDMGSG